MTAKLTPKDKDQIKQLIRDKKSQLGSFSAVATFCRVSSGTISQILQDSYKTEGDDMWLNIGAALGFKSTREGNAWTFVETTDFRSIQKLLLDAKNNALFMPISDIAGIGKSGAIKHYAETHKNNAVFYLRCWEWSKREFLENLCRTLGIDIGKGHKTPNNMIQLIVEFFQSKSLDRPQLIIDEADKPKGTAKLIYIPLFNECEDNLSVIIAGTEALEKEIKRGVRYQAKGFDEIDSRFGRKYIKLIGCNLSEVTKICQANGVSNGDVIKQIFEDCKPLRKSLQSGGREVIVRVITDLRRLKRLVQKELIKISNN